MRRTISGREHEHHEVGQQPRDDRAGVIHRSRHQCWLDRHQSHPVHADPLNKVRLLFFEKNS